MPRALIFAPRTARRGEVIEIRTLIAHPMESGQRSDGNGARVPRDIVRRLECRYEGERVFAADLYPAMAANPMVLFHTVATVSGTLTFDWRGDHDFAHRESVAITVE